MLFSNFVHSIISIINFADLKGVEILIVQDVFLLTFGNNTSMMLIVTAMFLVFFIIFMMDLIKGRW